MQISCVEKTAVVNGTAEMRAYSHLRAAIQDNLYSKTIFIELGLKNAQ